MTMICLWSVTDRAVCRYDTQQQAKRGDSSTHAPATFGSLKIDSALFHGGFANPKFMSSGREAAYSHMGKIHSGFITHVFTFRMPQCHSSCLSPFPATYLLRRYCTGTRYLTLHVSRYCHPTVTSSYPTSHIYP
jgi:hypothetical protein